ncbi:polysaccharide deacetylase family protein [uncultured Cyclobacterium sp.]|uniref:polysaccharide deacetylase family protein n=1 Tax=uncultured Cyclobacterium sp. TaxID=453820 RepID=UPI0030ED02EC|tara:strand:+ start:6043 stop:6879 length:837 start_codon:yes stop_codon:yes gene_type:complete
MSSVQLNSGLSYNAYTYLKVCTLMLFWLVYSSVNSQILIKPIPDKTVVLTFDDGVASHYSHVAPLLMERGFGATFFVCEFPPNFSDSTKYMNWRQMQELDRMGFEVANHTHHHAPVGKLSEEEVTGEINYIEAKCDSLGIKPMISFAYPGYSISEIVLKALDKKNYLLARAGGKRAYNPLEDHPYLIPSWATDSENEAETMEALKQAKAGQIVVLTIHGVPDLEHPWVNTPPDMFLRYLNFLSKNKYRVLSFEQLAEYIDFKLARKQLKVNFEKPLRN